MPPEQIRKRTKRDRPAPSQPRPEGRPSERAEGEVATEGRWGPPSLIVVSERPGLFAGIRPDRRVVLQWRPEGEAGEVRRFGTLFSGDPADPETYRSVLRGAGDIVAAVDLLDAERVPPVVEALRAALPEAAVLVLVESEELELPGAPAVRQVVWSTLLEPEIEFELARLANLRRVRRLRRFAEGAEVLPILIQSDPDPDGIASALALRILLSRGEAEAPIVSLGEITRPENRRMAKLLKVRVTQVTKDELARFERLLTVDVQPVDVPEGPRLAVVDHHPPEEGYDAEFRDIRRDYGATATIVTEYLRAADTVRTGHELATALLYGIKTDTASLSREVTPADVKAYAYLQEYADLALLGRIERPSFPHDMLRAIGRALAAMATRDDVAAAWMGEVPEDQVHVLPALADQCLAMQGVNWVAAAGLAGDRLVINVRHLGNGEGVVGAGELARRLAGEAGSGGGHSTMGRATIPRDRARRRLPLDEEGPTGSESRSAQAILDLVVEAIAELKEI